MTRTLLTLAALAALLLPACTGDSGKSDRQELVVTAVIGKVEAYRTNTQPQAVRAGLRLAEQWFVRTSGVDAVCSLQTPSGSVIRISGDTTLRLAELYKDSKLSVEKTGLELIAGKILVKARTLTGDDSFVVRTRTATAGVRGTRFVVAYDEQTGTQIAVESGRVAVGQPVTVDLPAGLTNARQDVERALERSTEVVVASNEIIAVTKNDNIVAQAAAQQLVQDRLVPAAAAKPEDLKKALQTFSTIAATNAVARPEKKTVSELDAVVIKDFVELRTLAPVKASELPARPAQEANTVKAITNTAATNVTATNAAATNAGGAAYAGTTAANPGTDTQQNTDTRIPGDDGKSDMERNEQQRAARDR